MNFGMVFLAGAVGYLSGSFSAARAVVRTFAPDHKMEGIQVEVPDGSASFQSDVMSATTVRLHLGSKFGCLTAVLDIMKAALPALLFRWWQPGEPYYLAAAGMATVGHIWPVFYRFKGGRGMSPILGGFLMVDWLGVIITQAVGALSGTIIKNTMIMIGTGIALMVPWVWIRSRSWPEVIYVLAMNLLFWYAMGPELKEFRRMKEEGSLEDFAAAEQVRIVGRRGEEIQTAMRMDNLKAWFQALFKRSGGSPDQDESE